MRRARDELAVAGARPRPGAGGGSASLTPSERRVAELAAAGRSNREIAQQLYLSLKTIEVHLSSSYRKLGIRSRGELGSALRSCSPGRMRRAPRPIDEAYRGGAGSPLVLLHGLTASWRIWQPVIARLESHHDVFAPALAGHHGGPALEPANGGLPAICDALERTLDDAGIGAAHLVGQLVRWLGRDRAGAPRPSAERRRPSRRPAAGGSARNLRRLVRTFRLYDGRIEPHRDRLMAGAQPALACDG